MLTKEELFEVLRSVNDPEIGENIVDLNMVKEVKLDEKESKVILSIALTVPECPLTGKIRKEVSSILEAKGAKKIEINFTSMNENERSVLVEKIRGMRQARANEGVGGKSNTVVTKPATSSPIGRLGKGDIHNIIAVASGKGGVGKSSITALLAVELTKRGFKVAVLDADVTGPSIPKLFGLKGRLTTDGKKLFPAISKTGIEVASMNLIVENETDATIWRGPIINGVIRHVFTDVEWGELDYMILDLPPGTSDAPLTVFQSIPLDGLVVVTSPQELARVIVGKSINMAKKLRIPVFGLIENMAYMQCPECNHRIYLYGKPVGESVAREFGISFLGRLPLDPLLPSICDEGKIEEYGAPEIQHILQKLGEARVKILELKQVAS
jgi:Mrp family chromosome partitioning ATPase